MIFTSIKLKNHNYFFSLHSISINTIRLESLLIIIMLLIILMLLILCEINYYFSIQILKSCVPRDELRHFRLPIPS